ncbi:MAG: YhbY family RNA-binding protein [Bacilli bacterium]
MLNREQIKYLRKYAHKLKPVFQVGKSGESFDQLNSIEEYLAIHEIVKVSILNNAPEERDYYVDVLDEAGFEIVNVIGKTITIYKHSDNENKKSRVKLPR